ncbi:hypothetical protein PGQ11_011259 [Apiospora arundinis]|uniref:Uncharacterized protein n=1 Tax=Apiospora arundinis TaxID=335852 RepID=A0ABR2HZY0_9PEZI
MASAPKSPPDGNAQSGMSSFDPHWVSSWRYKLVCLDDPAIVCPNDPSILVEHYQASAIHWHSAFKNETARVTDLIEEIKKLNTRMDRMQARLLRCDTILAPSETSADAREAGGFNPATPQAMKISG